MYSNYLVYANQGIVGQWLVNNYTRLAIEWAFFGKSTARIKRVLGKNQKIDEPNAGR